MLSTRKNKFNNRPLKDLHSEQVRSTKGENTEIFKNENKNICHRKCRDSRLNKISKMALLLHRIRSLLAHFAVFASSSYCNLKSSSWYCTGLLALELEWGIGAGLCAPRGGRDHGNKQPLHKIHRNNRPKSTSVRSLLAVSLAPFLQYTNKCCRNNNGMFGSAPRRFRQRHACPVYLHAVAYCDCDATCATCRSKKSQPCAL